jgi:hypothetical protein
MFGRTKINDPWNTQGTPAPRQRRSQQQPSTDVYREDHGHGYMADSAVVVPDLRKVPVEGVARGYGLTLEAAARFAQAYEAGKDDFCAQVTCMDILDDPRNRKKW